MNTQTKSEETKELDIPMGVSTIISKRLGCTPIYVGMVLRKKRNQNTELAKQIIHLYEVITGEKYPESLPNQATN